MFYMTYAYSRYDRHSWIASNITEVHPLIRIRQFNAMKSHERENPCYVLMWWKELTEEEVEAMKAGAVIIPDGDEPFDVPRAAYDSQVAFSQ